MYFCDTLLWLHRSTAPYKSFLAFQVVESDSIDNTFQDTNSYDALVNIQNELACAAEPVDLHTGNFHWEYTGFALYGAQNLNFSRYYESRDAASNHGLGSGWSTDYTVDSDVMILSEPEPKMKLVDLKKEDTSPEDS